MYRIHQTYIKADMKMSVLLNDNPMLLLMLEHLNIDFAVRDKTVGQICGDNKADPGVFMLIANMYNGFYPARDEIESITDISMIIDFLKNSHNYYKNDKYPEIKHFIERLQSKHKGSNIGLVEQFFNEYFEEVLEHLDYEDEIAFPYFCQLSTGKGKGKPGKSKFSVNEYREHHTDIETKLTDLKNLLLKHISIENELPLRRKFLVSLFELEYDLNIHSMVEEMILLPVVDKLERKIK